MVPLLALAVVGVVARWAPLVVVHLSLGLLLEL